MAQQLSFKYIIEECESEDPKEAGSDDEEANLDENEINKRCVLRKRNGGSSRSLNRSSMVYDSIVKDADVPRQAMGEMQQPRPFTHASVMCLALPM
ncbi:hypothetical protein DPMN_152147 [Dreissena polymorpha]|uniref:Uncharacterized protein n=1 Tax=Dreissena polymorpha TaxID=45954 RepID=A0A9D4J827_DREPO|nr:hypothetical protein DPMN_152147 [Dreissena polymorpha]